MKENKTDQQTISVEVLPLVEKVKTTLEKQRLLSKTDFDGWEISLFFGPLPNSSDVPTLGYTANAKTNDTSKAFSPDISGTDGVRVDFDEKAIIWWSGPTLELLTKTVEDVFPELNLSGDTKEEITDE